MIRNNDDTGPLRLDDHPVDDVLVKIQAGASGRGRASRVYEEQRPSAFPSCSAVKAEHDTASWTASGKAIFEASEPPTRFSDWASLGATELPGELAEILAQTQITIVRIDVEGRSTAGVDFATALSAPLCGHRALTRTTVDARETRFNALAEEWRSRLPRYARVLEMATDPAYQQIIGMGRGALPFILRELSQRPDHWFWALKAITGEDPVEEADRGNLNRMASAWFAWGARNGYEF